MALNIKSNFSKIASSPLTGCRDWNSAASHDLACMAQDAKPSQRRHIKLVLAPGNKKRFIHGQGVTAEVWATRSALSITLRWLS